MLMPRRSLAERPAEHRAQDLEAVEAAQRGLRQRVDAADHRRVDGVRGQQALRGADGLRAGRTGGRDGEAGAADAGHAPQRLHDRPEGVLAVQLVVRRQRAGALPLVVGVLGARQARGRRADDQCDPIGAVARDGAGDRGSELGEPGHRQARGPAVPGGERGGQRGQRIRDRARRRLERQLERAGPQARSPGVQAGDHVPGGGSQGVQGGVGGDGKRSGHGKSEVTSRHDITGMERCRCRSGSRGARSGA